MTKELIKFEDIELKRYNIFTSEDFISKKYQYDKLKNINNISFNVYCNLVYCPEDGLSPRKQQEKVKQLIYASHLPVYKNEKLIIFTYSSYITCMLNNLLFAYLIKDKQNIYPQNMLMNPNETNAYYIRDDGRCVDMWDENHELFVCEDLEADILSRKEFDKLLDLKYTFTWDGVDYDIRENDDYDHPFITCPSCQARSYFTSSCKLCEDAFDQFNNTEGADINE